MKFAYFSVRHSDGHFLIMILCILCSQLNETHQLSNLSVLNASVTGNPNSNILKTDCRFNKNETNGYITKEEIPDDLIKYSIAQNKSLDCVWNIEVDQGYKIKLSFFDMMRPCEDENFLYIDEDKPVDLQLKRLRLCSRKRVQPIKSTDNHMSIRLSVKSSALDDVRFYVNYNSYRELTNNETCRDDEFDCLDSTCVSYIVRCDGWDNCDNGLDEAHNSTCAPYRPPPILSILTPTNILLVSALVFGLFVAFFVFCCRKICCKRNVAQVSAHYQRNSSES